MKDLYEALEHKEKQLHDFMRTYDHVSIFTVITSFDGQPLKQFFFMSFEFGPSLKKI